MNGMNMMNSSCEIGWKMVPFIWPWWVIVQLVLSVTGIVGNLLVIAVIVRRGPGQFTTDALIGNLAVADFVTSLLMIPRPQMVTVPSNWKGRLYCRIEYPNTLMWISAVASMFILTVISVERLVAVKYPFRFKVLFSVKRSLRFVGLSWLGAAILNTYTLVISQYDEVNCTCKTDFLRHGVHTVTGIGLFFFKYLIPITIMIGSHLAIIRELRAQARNFQKDGQNAPPPVQQLSETMRRMTRTVLIVVIIFFICWTPDQICFTLFNIDLYPSYMYSDIYRVFVCLGFINNCSNPFIYSARNKKFRTELLEIMCLSSSKKKRKSLPMFSPLVKSRIVKTISGEVKL